MSDTPETTRPINTFEVSFPGGVAVEATFRGHSVRTDQPKAAGGNDSAMAPFDLFLASIATCAGFYALRFCQQREIDTTGLRVTLTPIRDAESKRVATVRIDLQTPDHFPEKYLQALVRAVDQCAVKKHIVEPPQFEVNVIGTGVTAS